jgi:hypothetical protein
MSTKERGEPKPLPNSHVATHLQGDGSTLVLYGCRPKLAQRRNDQSREERHSAQVKGS